ncbi:hypothetical protein DXG01_013741 [Tephrocybe rancida]|nr:hypothetical protein DXG01_013741 [Tephrocybe rancida]
MISTNSAHSFDFVEVVDPDESQLLSPSFSLDSLWSIDSDDTVPPFPERPVVRIVPILLDDRCMLHPFGRGKKGPDEFKVLTSIATPPRMRNLLLEPLCIDKWVVSRICKSASKAITHCSPPQETVSIRTQPPGHIPWGPPAPIKECPWVPSGSLFSPGNFKHALSLTRGAYRKASAPLTAFNSVLSRPNGRRSSRQSGSFRKALVFEHEITLNTEGQTKRWSLQVPAETMNPEMVDIMLELQDLNSFFKDSLAGLDKSVAVLAKEKDKLNSSEPPALIVSDSHQSFPLSNEPSAQTRPDVLAPLATRRGRRLLPPLALADKVDKDPYPSIPTAFLGSPSAYSPKFECATTGDGPSLDLEHMVTNLRSQCIFPRTPDQPSPQSPVGSPLSEMSFAAASDQGNSSDDDWAFATSFLGEFGNQVADLKSDPASRELKPTSLCGELRPGADILSDESLTPRAHSPAYPPSPAPSTPLPPLPSPILHELSLVSPSPRGILKSCKNVRFASLPDRFEIADEDNPSTPPPTAAPLQPPKAPLRLHAYSRPSKQSVTSPPVNSSAPQTSSQTADKKTEKPGNNRPASAFPPSRVEPQPSKKPTFAVHRSPLRPRSAVALARKSTPLPPRQPLDRLDSRDENQEASGVPTSPQNKAGLRWTMNDMTFRRGSNQATPEGTPKSRMPVPLRNILTRFK